MRNRSFSVAAAAALVVVACAAELGAARPSPPAASKPTAFTAKARVDVDDNFFEPRSVTAQRGARVVWHWRGENRHNVTFTKVPPGASKRGAATRRDGRWHRAFYKRGIYKFVCTIHAGMRGSILVP
jgi:plastocyanin